MLLAPYPDDERRDDSEWSPAQPLAPDVAGTCLAEQVLHALRQSGYSALHSIEVTVRESTVLLEGRVASYHLKQLAQETIRRAFGDPIIWNNLKVVS